MKKSFAMILLCLCFFTIFGWADDMDVNNSSSEPVNTIKQDLTMNEESETDKESGIQELSNKRPKSDKNGKGTGKVVLPPGGSERSGGEKSNETVGAEMPADDVQEEVQIVLAENKDFALIKGTTKQMPRMVIENNRTLVPIHFFREIKSSKVVYNPAEKSVTIASNNKVVRMVAEQKEIKVNGQPKLIDVPMKIDVGRAYVPVRYVAEIFGYEVGFIKNSGAPTMVGICSKGCSVDYNRALEIFGN